MGRWIPGDALQYTQGVDRSPTEVAALFLADNPNDDPVVFLVEACGLDKSDATEAVGYLDDGDAKPKPKRGRAAAAPAGDGDAKPKPKPKRGRAAAAAKAADDDDQPPLPEPDGDDASDGNDDLAEADGDASDED